MLFNRAAGTIETLRQLGHRQAIGARREKTRIGGGMTDEPANLMLEHLKSIRASQDRIETRLDDMTARLGHLETVLARVQVQLGEQAVQLAEQSVRFDRVESRLARIAPW
jgi:phage-related minor tail protein